MGNATLVINNSKEFCDDIWQYKNDFSEEQWKAAFKEFASIIQDAYDYLNKDDEYPDDKLYQVGDVANMLSSIEVKLK